MSDKHDEETPKPVVDGAAEQAAEEKPAPASQPGRVRLPDKLTAQEVAAIRKNVSTVLTKAGVAHVIITQTPVKRGAFDVGFTHHDVQMLANKLHPETTVNDAPKILKPGD